MESTVHARGRLHLVDLLHDAVWVPEESVLFDSEHLEALAQLGLGAPHRHSTYRN